MRKLGEGPHYVYYLYDKDGLLADIGRSVNPESRRRIKQRQWKETFTMKVSRPIEDLDAACDREREELRRYRPRLSMYVRSARGAFGISINKGVPKSAAQIAKLTGPNNGMYGKHHTPKARKAMSKKRKGVPFSTSHRANVAAANRTPERRAQVSADKKGKPLSPEHLKSIRKALKSPETRAKMSASHTDLKPSMEAVAKRAASNTGKKRTPAQIKTLRKAQQLSWAKRKSALNPHYKQEERIDEYFSPENRKKQGRR